MNSQSAGGNKFLLVRGADDEVNQVVQRARLFAGARARAGEIARRAGSATAPPRPAAVWQTTRSVARGVSSSGSAGGESQFSSSWTSLLFLLGLLGPGKAVGAGVRLQFRRHGTFGAQKQKRQFLQPRLALRVQQARPPVRVGKIAARERQLFKIILQRQPRALRIGAGRETFQNVLALVDGGLGVGQFAAQIGERAVGLRQHLVVRVVFGRARRGGAPFPFLTEIFGI